MTDISRIAMMEPHGMSEAFFDRLDRHGDNSAIISAATGERLDYRTLEQQVAERAAMLGQDRKLIFVEADNSIGSIIDYLAALRGRHPVYLTDDLASPKILDLIDHYRPQLLIRGDRTIDRSDAPSLPLHADLALLLSTSGSTGSPKFVKLSIRNIDANARAICEYLELDANDRALQHLKPHYSYGLSIINSHLACGATLILTDAGATDDMFWDIFRTYEATSFAGVPYTFETLKRRGFAVSDFPSLRYATQAGGKLEKLLVAEFAEAFAQAGKRFYVMYGQTEAAPRIAYLPPALAARAPGAIGRAIPGGTLYLVDQNDAVILEPGKAGELVYEGPNVMMGYASAPADLASDDTPARLMTGDIAERGPDDLFFIVGRSSRFVKPFGIRVNLDEVQSFVRAAHGPSAVTGDDRQIIVAMEGLPSVAQSVDVPGLADRFGLPGHLFSIRAYPALPLLSNGKYDFQTILTQPPPQPPSGLFRRLISGAADILGLSQKRYASVQELYALMLSKPQIPADASFQDLSVDSLSYVALSIEIEELFRGNPPPDWETLPISALEEAYQSRMLESAS